MKEQTTDENKKGMNIIIIYRVNMVNKTHKDTIFLYHDIPYAAVRAVITQ